MIPFYESRREDLYVKRLDTLDFFPHLHAQLELLYMENGSMELTAGGRTRLLMVGDLAVLFPNRTHSYATPKGQAKVQAVLILADLSLAVDSVNTLLKFHPRDPVLRGERLHRDIPYAIHALASECEDSPASIGCSLICRACVQMLVSRLLPQMELVPNADANYYDSICKVIGYINEHFTQPLSLKTLSTALGVERYHLSRIFSATICVRFTDYVNGIRALRARDLLGSTDESITRIAFDCGFQSTRTFNRVFRKVYGQSPRDVRAPGGNSCRMPSRADCPGTLSRGA